MVFSSVLAIGKRRDIGRYDEPNAGSLFGLVMGMILSRFQICGIVFVLRNCRGL